MQIYYYSSLTAILNKILRVFINCIWHKKQIKFFSTNADFYMSLNQMVEFYAHYSLMKNLKEKFHADAE